MPRIDDELLNCAVYLYASHEDASRGRRAGGSGFLLGVPAPAPEPLQPPPPGEMFIRYERQERWPNSHVYVITNTHVIDDGYPVVRLNTKDGVDIAPLKSGWIRHSGGADVAACPIELSAQHYYMLVGYELILSKSSCTALDVGMGDDIMTIGRFVNHEGKQQNRPVVRFGNVSMLPDENDPLKINRRLPPQVSYLVESRTVPGYSGSPVFLSIPPWELAASRNWTREDIYRRYGSGIVSPTVWLLGITWGFIEGANKSVVTAHSKKVPGLKVPSNTGMMAVVPAWKLLELLNQPELVEQRAAERLHWEENPPSGVLA